MIFFFIYASLFVMLVHILVWTVKVVSYTVFIMFRDYVKISNHLLKLSTRIGVYLSTVWKRYFKDTGF